MEELTDQHIKEFLEEAPLYFWREFKKPKLNRSGLWIKEIDSFCKTCDQVRPFHENPSHKSVERKLTEAKGYLSTGQSYFKFLCVSCKKDCYEYCVDQVVSENTIKIQKYGELPRKHLDRDKLLQKFFSDDSDCYEKAVVCLSNGYGIAAFAYLRRIIEKNILKLLGMLQEDVNSSGGDSAIEGALAELRKDSPMSDKIEIANNALPAYLNPDGLNPLGKLYRVLSEGVHKLSDQECLQRANTVKECLKYLINELATRKENSNRFKKSVSSLR